MKTDNAFRLSRVQAEGWQAARRVPSERLGDLDATKIDALNPYADGPERDRWNTGFQDALESWKR